MVWCLIQLGCPLTQAHIHPTLPATHHHHGNGHIGKLVSPSPVHLLTYVQIILFLKSKFDCHSSKPFRDPYSLQEKA